MKIMFKIGMISTNKIAMTYINTNIIFSHVTTEKLQCYKPFSNTQ